MRNPPLRYENAHSAARHQLLHVSKRILASLIVDAIAAVACLLWSVQMAFVDPPNISTMSLAVGSLGLFLAGANVAWLIAWAFIERRRALIRKDKEGS